MGKRCGLLSQASQAGLKQTSVIREIFLLGQQKKETSPEMEIIDLSLGNPDLEPPKRVLEALAHLTACHESQQPRGWHRYMDNAGFPDVRASLAERLSVSEGVDLCSESVFMTCGAAGALHILLKCLLDPGDEVVLFAPYFVEYTTYVREHGGVHRIVPFFGVKGREDTPSRFLPDLEKLQATLSSKTRLLILNSPNNPSGCVYPRTFYQDLAAVLQEHQQQTGHVVQVISDEPYAHLVFSGHQHSSCLKEVPGSWLVRSHSKDLGLAGERIGFIGWESAEDDAQVLDAMRAAARALGFVNAPALMQRLLPLVHGASVETEVYEERVHVFCQILMDGGLDVEVPGGTFFVCPRVPEGFTDTGFCEALAQEGVLVVPAAAFGAPGYFRASLTQPLEKVKSAAHAIVRLAGR